jgi:SpoVK/Ycf46/Vps4 family AAA+-type ATPase
LQHWLEHQKKLLTADLKSRKLRPPRGVLLVGLPGCGKSLSAKYIAANWNLTLYRLDLAAIQRQNLGQSENRLKDALASADNAAPCILWFDEIEKGLSGATAASDGGTSVRMVGQFLFWLHESTAKVFIVATANDVSKLPPELLRKGRFDELFFVDLPGEEERKDIFQLYIQRNLL